jgi:RNA polymerase sigma-70 factor, ECF subfamily
VSGERERFEVMFRARHDAMLAFALRRAQPDDARDVVAETFLVAWRRFRDLPVDAELPWLYGIARRVLANQRRGARRRAALTTRLAEPPIFRAPSDGALAEALVMLADRDREALLLVAWEGLSAEEGAQVVGCRTGTFRMRVHRARQRLAALLDDRAAVVATASPSMEERS